MSALLNYLRNSRLASAIAQVEADETVDYAKLTELQTLDLGRIGELFVLDQLEREDAADGGYLKPPSPPSPSVP